MKINILYTFKEGAWGGGNQFLKALRKEFIKKGVYEEDPQKADVIIFNSHHNLKKLIKTKKKFPDKIFIHRLDGPIYKVRGSSKEVDKIIFKFNSLIADGTVFQSHWSRQQNHKSGCPRNSYETVIINAPDPDIFNQKGKRDFDERRKTRLVATSWSANYRKGFDFYKYLDENLDFSRYEMTFFGNSPIEFNNIKCKKPLPSKELAQKLKKHDIFITASQNDPCSNSLLEALHCGLPTVAYDDGGHPELVGKGGEVFNDNQEGVKKIDKVRINYNFYQNNIRLPFISEVGNKYLEFVKEVFYNKKAPESISEFLYMKISIQLFLWKLKNKFLSLLRIKNIKNH